MRVPFEDRQARSLQDWRCSRFSRGATRAAQAPDRLDTVGAERNLNNLERMLALPEVSQENAAEAQRVASVAEERRQ